MQSTPMLYFKYNIIKDYHEFFQIHILSLFIKPQKLFLVTIIFLVFFNIFCRDFFVFTKSNLKIFW